MGKKKLDEKTRRKAIKEFKSLIEKYGVSVYTIGIWLRDDQRRTTYNRYIPEDKKIHKPFPKALDEIVKDNFDKSVKDIRDIIYERYPNNGYDPKSLYGIIYSKKNKERHSKICQAYYEKNRTKIATRKKDYYKNRVKTIGVVVVKTKD